MKCKVLKILPYARDGIRVETLPVGWEGEILDELIPGLIAEKYVEPAAADAAPVEAPPSAVEAPAAAPAPPAAPAPEGPAETTAKPRRQARARS